MANELGRVRAIASGYTGAPGLTQFYFQGSTPGTFSNADATAAVAAVKTYLEAVKSVFATGTTIQVQSAVDVVDWVSGALVGNRAATGVTVVICSGLGIRLVAEAALVQWYTQTVVGRRLLRGRTFLSPMGANMLASDGSVLGTTVSTVVAAGNALIATPTVTLSTWHRPVPFRTGNNGTCAAIISNQVPNKVAILRSRRD